MNNSGEPAVALLGLGLVMIVALAVVAIGFYIFGCYCLKRICEKCGQEPGVLIWFPILHLFPLLKAAGMEMWMFILLLIPVVNIVIAIMMWVKICQARGKSGWLVILMFVPIANIFFVPYLAFSE